MGKFLKAAQITKVRKRQGRLVVQPCDGLPFLLFEGLTAHIVPPSLDVPRTVVLSEAAQGADCTVAFQGVDDYAQLVEYVGRYLLVARADIDEELLPEELPAVEGFHVVDRALGELGEAVEFLENAFQSTLVVEGPYGEVLIPFVDEFIEGIDEEAGLVFTRVPGGLVGLASAPAVEDEAEVAGETEADAEANAEADVKADAEADADAGTPDAEGGAPCA